MRRYSFHPDHRVQIRKLETLTELRCESNCDLTNPPSYVWFNKEQKIEEKTSCVKVSVRDEDSYSCTVKGHEDHRSPSVCEFTPQCFDRLFCYTDVSTFRMNS